MSDHSYDLFLIKLLGEGDLHPRISNLLGTNPQNSACSHCHGGCEGPAFVCVGAEENACSLGAAASKRKAERTELCMSCFSFQTHCSGKFLHLSWAFLFSVLSQGNGREIFEHITYRRGGR